MLSFEHSSILKRQEVSRRKNFAWSEVIFGGYASRSEARKPDFDTTNHATNTPVCQGNALICRDLQEGAKLQR